jgi:Immunoglobulin-like domain of bacterial spore germination/Sporulation and spore germination
MRRLTSGVGVFAVLCALTACTGRPTAPGAATQGRVAAVAPPTATATAVLRQDAATPARPDLHLHVYYPRTVDGRQYLVPERHPVPGTRAVAAAAVNELLRGRPMFPGSRRPFAAGTRLRGVRVDGGTATVDLSREVLRGRPGDAQRYPLQALVHTVTQFRTVKRVVVAVEGRTSGTVAGRSLAEFWDVAPGEALVRDRTVRLAPISVVDPGPGTLVEGGRLVVRGHASVYEGTVSLRLRDGGGLVMAQGYTTAATAAPGRGPFSGALTFTAPAQPQRWTLEVFEVSAEDGSVVYWVHVPLWVGR